MFMESVFIVLMVLLDCTLAQIIQKQYKKQRGTCSQDSLLWKNTSPRSTIQCVIECKQSDSCFTVTISTLTTLCSYYDVGFVSEDSPLIDCTLSSESDDILVFVKSIPGKRI